MEHNDLIDRNTLLELLNAIETPIIPLDEAKEFIGIQKPILNSSVYDNSIVYDHGELEHATIPHNCVNCGGKVSKLTGICLYCGTEY